MTNLNTTTKKWIWNTWNQYQPDWFVTLLWNDLPTSEITSSSHTRHLRNLTLRKTTGSNSCSEIPDCPDRLGMTVFQERTESQGNKVTFHTHLHLFNTQRRWNDEGEVYYYLRHVIGSKVMKLLKSDTPGNQGVVVKPWNEDHHKYYNLKEMERQKKKVLTRYTQDKDLLLDIKNSNLLPL